MKTDFYDVAQVREALHCPVPSLTPQFNRDGSINWENSRKVIETCIEGGAKSLLVTYGDSLLTILTDAETMEYNRFVAQVADKRAMVIACSKTWCPSQLLEAAEISKADGCDMFIPVLPDWAQSLDTAEMTAFFRDAGKIMPVMLLTNMLNGRGIPFSVFDQLQPEDGVVAIKDDMAAPYGKTLLGHTRDKFAFLQGGRAFNYVDLEPFGADGYLSVYARVFPKISNEFWDTYHRGDILGAVKLVEKYDVPFFDLAAGQGIHFSALIQGMYEIAGVGTRWRRAPYSSMTDAQMEVLRGFLADRGVI